MSYDIHLYLPVTGESPLVTVQKDLPVDVPLSAEARERNIRAIVALTAFNPNLEVFEFSTGVQITSPNDGTGISIELFNDSGAITVPYWHDTEAERVLSLLGEYLEIVSTAAGFGAYDPQLETVLNSTIGFEPSPMMYCIGVNVINVATKKSWWKFW